MKRRLVFALCLLLAMPLIASGEQPVLTDEVQTSLSESETTGLGLAFRFRFNATGVAVDEASVFDNTNATVLYEGERRPLLAMGAVVTNNAAIGTQAEQLVRETANTLHTVVDIAGETLCEVTESRCTFAVRIIRIPDQEKAKATPIYARPYYVVSVDGEPVTVYGAVVSTPYQAELDSLYAVTLPSVGADIDELGRLLVDGVSIDGRTVSLQLKNISQWMPVVNSWVGYTCYGENGAALITDRIPIGDLWAKTTCEYVIELPEGTQDMSLTGYKIDYWTEWA